MADMRANTDARAGGDAAMGQFGRIAKFADLPKDRGVEGADPQGGGAQRIRRQIATRSEAHAEGAAHGARADLAAALRRNRVAHANFDAMSPSHRREYIEWLVDAKRDETRRKRLATAIEWIGEGKSKEWKYRGR